MSRVLFIPGLAADKSVYKNINLPGHDVVFVEWIEPDRNDTLNSYAQKLIIQYNITDKDILIGNSLGGIITVEIAKSVKLNKAIITSTIKSHTEAPWYFYVFRVIPLYVIVPGKLYIALSYQAKKVFYRLSKEDAKIYRDMFYGTSSKFLKWAMKAILQWRNTDIPENLYHITGNNDIVFSHRRIKGATIIEGGDHAMIYNRPDEMNKLLNDILAK